MSSATQAAPTSKKMTWAGRIISGVTVLFLIFDGVTKVIKERHVLEASAKLGYPVNSIVGIGAALLICVVAYVIPRTSVLGAILLTRYLGGAVATHVRVGDPIFDTVFPVIFGALVWGGLFLREGAPARADSSSNLVRALLLTDRDGRPESCLVRSNSCSLVIITCIVQVTLLTFSRAWKSEVTAPLRLPGESLA